MQKELHIQLKDGQQTIASLTFETTLNLETLIQRVPELLRTDDGSAATPAGLDSVGDRYRPLAAYLHGQDSSVHQLVMSFADVERVLGTALPSTARGPNTRSWWANTQTHSQGKAWHAVGWRVSRLDPQGEEVQFSRA